MPTTYEWVVETLDFYDQNAEPDIIDCPSFPSLLEAYAYADRCEEPWRMALRRDTGNVYEGLVERYYAYPDASGELPETMESATGMGDGPTIPRNIREQWNHKRGKSANYREFAGDEWRKI